jgi:hypothetical protein
MGYGIELKSCSRTCSSECACYIVDESYLPYNFAKFKHYWYIGDSYGHTCYVVAKQLKRTIATLEEENVSDQIPDGCDGWSSEIEVFHYHLKRLLKFVEPHKKLRFFTDSKFYYEDIGESGDETGSESDDETGDESKDDTNDHNSIPEIYFRHPIKGHMKVDTFEKASEIYTIMSIADDPLANSWLRIAKILQ